MGRTTIPVGRRMKMKLKLFILMLTALVVMVPAYAQESKEAALVREAKITMAEARAKALQRVPGNVESGRLERERGKLWYEFEIHDKQNSEVEIHIDAITGEVGEFEQETGKASAKEAEMFRQAKTSFEDAERTALGRTAGSIVKFELESERGVVLYEFEIITGDGKEVMVRVNAVSGEIGGSETGR